MKIALAQMRVHAGNPALNYQTAKRVINQAKQSGIELIIFPELCIPGYLNGDSWERKSFVQDCEYYGTKLAKLADNIQIIFGNVAVCWEEPSEDGRIRLYNAAFYAKNSTLQTNPALELNFWPKTLLPNYREFDDSRHFYDLRKLAIAKNVQIDKLLAPIQVKIGTNTLNIAIGICEDAWGTDYKISIFNLLKTNYHINLAVNINCSPYSFQKREKRERTFANIAKKLKTNFLHVNCIGTQNIGKTIFGFDGSSGAISPKGIAIAQGDFFVEQLLVFRLNLITNSLEYVDAINYSIRNSLIPSTNEQTPPRNFTSRPEELTTALENIVRFICEEWMIKRIVIGASGGIDSALAAVLYSRILGKSNVYLINMPSKYNSNLTKNAAKALADNLGCNYAVYPIEPALDLTKLELKNLKFTNADNGLNVSPLVEENLQARDRGGRILAAVAASLNGVFSCNANKSELTVGYSTLYGDQAGFLAALGDLWKFDVYGIAKFYNNNVYQKEIIPVETLTVTPSAELSAEQDVMQNKGDPLVYPYHDYLFKSFVESWQRKTPFEILSAFAENKLEETIGCEKGLVPSLFPSAKLFIQDLERWWNLYQGMGVVKRVQAPPIVALTQRAFGFDHREAIAKPHYCNNYLTLKEKLLTLEQEPLPKQEK